MPNPTTSTAVYNADNELTNWNGATLTYDGSGNLLSDGSNTYGWNERNQLDSISGTTAASFEYGPFGRRLGKTINGNTTNFLYDGVNPVQELVGGSPSANLLTGLGVDEYFQRSDLTGTSNILTDALGSTLALADPTGTVQTQYTYDPFGGTTTQGAANANSFQFTGRENDSDGLYYYRARYYDPMVSRFISQDPFGLAAGDVNFYPYVGENPVGFVDPVGLDKKPPRKHPLGPFQRAAQALTGHAPPPPKGCTAVDIAAAAADVPAAVGVGEDLAIALGRRAAKEEAGLTAEEEAAHFAAEGSKAEQSGVDVASVTPGEAVGSVIKAVSGCGP